MQFVQIETKMVHEEPWQFALTKHTSTQTRRGQITIVFSIMYYVNDGKDYYKMAKCL